MAFGLNFFTLAPGLRVAGDSLAYAYKFTKKGGQGDGKEGLEVGLTDDPTIKLLEAAVSGYEQVSDRDAVYTTLVSGGLTEIVPGLAVGIDSLSSIEVTTSIVKLALAGSQPLLQFRTANVPAVTKVGDSGYTWDLPTATFAALKTAAETYQSDLKTKVDAMIAARIAADDTLTAAVAAQSTADVAARAALSGRLDTLEADPTTATAVAAGDAATLSSANTYTDTAVSNVIGTAPGVLDTLGEIADAINDDANAYTTLAASIAAVQTDVDGNESDGDAADAALSGRLDTLEADPTTATAVAAVQADVDANETASDAAEAALSGRLDTLEADPTTATAVAAVQSDVDQNESDADAAIAGEATTRANADTALSGRLDVLEADPTTATAVAAVQADVDQNESDADTALALKAPLADPDFTGILEVDTNARIEFADNLTKIHNVLRGTSINIGNNIEVKPAAAGGRVEITGDLLIDASDFVDAANDTAAAAAGVVVGQVYRNGSDLKVRVS